MIFELFEINNFRIRIFGFFGIFHLRVNELKNHEKSKIFKICEEIQKRQKKS